jgi:hypothetical protein
MNPRIVYVQASKVLSSKIKIGNKNNLNNIDIYKGINFSDIFLDAFNSKVVLYKVKTPLKKNLGIDDEIYVKKNIYTNNDSLPFLITCFLNLAITLFVYLFTYLYFYFEYKFTNNYDNTNYKQVEIYIDVDYILRVMLKQLKYIKNGDKLIIIDQNKIFAFKNPSIEGEYNIPCIFTYNNNFLIVDEIQPNCESLNTLDYMKLLNGTEAYLYNTYDEEQTLISNLNNIRDLSLKIDKCDKIEKENELRILRKEKRNQYLINKELFLKNSIKRNTQLV